MPKVKQLKIFKFYDKDNFLIAEVPCRYYQFASFVQDFLGYSEFLTKGQFTLVHRIDLVSAGRVLFSIVDMRHVLNQKNYIINFNPF